MKNVALIPKPSVARERVRMPKARAKSGGSWDYRSQASEWVTRPLPQIDGAVGSTTDLRAWDALQLIAYRGIMDTDVGVANRTLGITISGNGATSWLCESTIVQTAAQSFSYFFGIDIDEEARGVLSQRVPFWNPVIVGPTVLNVNIESAQPGDAISNQVIWFRAWKRTGPTPNDVLPASIDGITHADETNPFLIRTHPDTDRWWSEIGTFGLNQALGDQRPLQLPAASPPKFPPNAPLAQAVRDYRAEASQLPPPKKPPGPITAEILSFINEGKGNQTRGEFIDISRAVDIGHHQA